MTQHKHLKERVRARMEKTGESYVTARRQVLAKRPKAPARPLPAIPSRAKSGAARIGSEALRKRTGRGWDEWIALLDAAGGTGLDHRGLVARLVEAGVGPWWCQMIAVGYEQARGKRAEHQRCDGSFQAGVSKTFEVPVAALWEAWSAKGRRAWLDIPDGFAVRKSNPPRQVAKPTTPAASLRFDWSGGTLVLVYIYGKAGGRSSVSVQHEKLPDAAAVAASKTAWKTSLQSLAAFLDPT